MSNQDGSVDRARLIEAAEKQTLFREVNERINELNARFGHQDDRSWVCECEDASCSERIEMTLLEYERLRAGGNRFAVKPGHEVADVEDVIEQNTSYVVVAKRGAGGGRALERDPRATTDGR